MMDSLDSAMVDGTTGRCKVRSVPLKQDCILLLALSLCCWAGTMVSSSVPTAPAKFFQRERIHRGTWNSRDLLCSIDLHARIGQNYQRVAFGASSFLLDREDTRFCFAENDGPNGTIVSNGYPTAAPKASSKRMFVFSQQFSLSRTDRYFPSIIPVYGGHAAMLYKDQSSPWCEFCLNVESLPYRMNKHSRFFFNTISRELAPSSLVIN